MIKVFIIFAVVLAVTSLPHPHAVQWNQFKLAHNKAYDGQEEVLRFEIFSKNLKKIEEHNALYADGLKTYKMGVNKFADMTEEEFKNYLTLSGSKPSLDSEAMGEVYRPPLGLELPTSVDYRDKKAVNPVKDQGSCGSCWAFSTVGALESIYFLKKGKLYSLSEQNLVDCSNAYGNMGCDGGLMTSGYKYIKDNGLETETAYPYKAYDQSCGFNKTKSVVKVTGYTPIKSGSEADLQSAVATQGPTAVGVDASEWQFYSGGIFKSDATEWMLDHGVVVIGYGVEKGVEYWIVRNSWGPAWGEKGYIRIARNVNNQVGISNDACFPNV